MNDRSMRPGGPSGRPGRGVPPVGQSSRATGGSSNYRPRPAASSARQSNQAGNGYSRQRTSQRQQHTPSARRTSLSSKELGRQSASRTAKTVIALVSAAVLSLTGYAWGKLDELESGLTKNDVIDKRAEVAADGAIDILLVGNDSRVDAQGNPLPKQVLQELRAGDNEGHLTDSLILIRIPNDGGRASAMSFPRDSYVDVPGYGKNKVNSAYAFGRNAALKQLRTSGKDKAEQEREANTAGSKILIKTLEQLSGVEIDHYAEVNLLGFYEITKAVGGVDVCLNKATKDEKSGANFTQGPQTISGGDALAFVRQRYGLPRGDLDRVVRQQVFMAGLAKKILSGGTLTDTTKLTDLINALKKSIILDRNWDVIAFAKQMQGMAGGKISFTTIPLGPPTKTSDGQEVLTVEPRKVKEFAAKLLKGESTDSSSSENSGQPDRNKTKVDVFNTTNTTGLATKVQEALASKGFSKGKSENAPPRAKTLIRYAKGGRAVAEQVAQALGGGATVEENSKVSPGTVEVYLGKDYQGPGAAGVASTSVQLRSASTPLHSTARSEQPITADGVTCVN